MEKSIKNLWTQYQAKRGDSELRNILVELYMPLAEKHAALMSAKLPLQAHIPYDDLLIAGCIGLIHAAKSFNMDRGVKFELYAKQRIRGEMLDWLRSNDWIPRMLRAKDKEVQRAEQSFMAEVGRKPADEELARWMGIDEVELDQFKAKRQSMKQISLESQASGSSDSDDNMEIKHCLRDKRTIPVERKLERKEGIEALTRGFSCREKLIINLRYYEGLTLREIGMVVGMSETRISQMLSNLLNQIKAKINRAKGDVICRN